MALRTRANVPHRQMLVMRFVDVGVGGVRLLGEQRRDRHDHSGLAVAALRHLLIEPRLLHGVEHAVRGEAFDRRDRGALDRRHGHAARPLGLAVDVHGARPAIADAAPEFRAGQPQRFADRPEQRRVRIDVQ